MLVKPKWPPNVHSWYEFDEPMPGQLQAYEVFVGAAVGFVRSLCERQAKTDRKMAVSSEAGLIPNASNGRGSPSPRFARKMGREGPVKHFGLRIGIFSRLLRQRHRPKELNRIGQRRGRFRPP